MVKIPGEAAIARLANGAQVSGSGDGAARWAPLCRVGAAAALTTAVLIPIQVAVFLIWPPPLDGTADDWFALLRSNRLAGLVDLDLLLAVDNVLLIPLFLALYVVLRRAHESAMTLAVAFGLVGIVLYLASNPAVQMAALSDQYAAATTDAQRAAARAAGEAMLGMWQGSAFHAAYLLGSVAGIVVGFVLLRAGRFGRAAGWLAILANALGLGLYVPRVGVYISVFSVVFLEAWYLLVARHLGRIGRGAPT
jgi:hypothetical protein